MSSVMGNCTFASSAQMSAQQAVLYRNAESQVQNLLKGKKVESKGMFASMRDGIAEFFHENRSLITWIALIFLVDHFFFKNVFRERLHKMVDGAIGKIEKKIEAQ